MEISIIRDSLYYYETSKFSYVFILASGQYMYDKIVQRVDMKFLTNYRFGNDFFIIPKKYSHFNIINIIELNSFIIVWN